LKALHRRQLQVEHHAVEALSLELLERILARADRAHLHVLAVP